jgi:glycosyltransferase involved in cell wall biosynthesis
MRLTIITSPFSCLPPTGVGAVEKIWASMGEEFARQGHKVVIVCKDDADSTSVHSGKTTRIGLSGFARTGTICHDLILDFLYSFRALWRLETCDVLILNTFWTPFLCGFFKYKYNRIVYSVNRTPKGQFRFLKSIHRLACVSEAIKKELLRQSPARRSQVKVIGNPIDSVTFRFREPVSQDHDLRICYTGRVHPEKGLDILVKAFVTLRNRHPELVLTIVGPTSIADGGGGPAYVDHLNGLADGCEIDWVGPIASPTRLAEQISVCDIYCYPSVAESGEAFGVAPLEAMAVGRPVVVSALECFADFIEHEQTGLVFNHRSAVPEAALTENLERLISESHLRERLARQGSKVAHKHFSVETISQQYLEDFKSLLET